MCQSQSRRSFEKGESSPPLMAKGAWTIRSIGGSESFTRREQNAPCHGAQLEWKENGSRDVEVPEQHVDHDSAGEQAVSACVVGLAQQKASTHTPSIQ